MLPRATTYVELLGQWSALGGPLARAEAGTRLGPVGLFAFGEWGSQGPRAGAGARVTW